MKEIVFFNKCVWGYIDIVPYFGYFRFTRQLEPRDYLQNNVISFVLDTLTISGPKMQWTSPSFTGEFTDGLCMYWLDFSSDSWVTEKVFPWPCARASIRCLETASMAGWVTSSTSCQLFATCLGLYSQKLQKRMKTTNLEQTVPKLLQLGCRHFFDFLLLFFV